MLRLAPPPPASPGLKRLLTQSQANYHLSIMGSGILEVIQTLVGPQINRYIPSYKLLEARNSGLSGLRVKLTHADLQPIPRHFFSSSTTTEIGDW